MWFPLTLNTEHIMGVTMVKRKSTGLVKFYRSIFWMFFFGGGISEFRKVWKPKQRIFKPFIQPICLGFPYFPTHVVFKPYQNCRIYPTKLYYSWKFNSHFAPEELLGPKRIVFLCYHFAGVNSLLNLGVCFFFNFFLHFGPPKTLSS